MASFRLEVQDGSIATVSAERDYEFLAAPFAIAPTVTIPVGGYAFDRVVASYQLAPALRLHGTVSANVGSFYDGSRTEARYAGRLQVSSQFTVEPTISLNWIDLPWGAFRTNLVSMRSTYTLSPRSALGALVQYNSSSHTVASNIRLRWEYIPGSDLYVVYTEGRNTLVPDRFAELQNRTLVVKLTRLWRY